MLIPQSQPLPQTGSSGIPEFRCMKLRVLKYAIQLVLQRQLNQMPVMPVPDNAQNLFMGCQRKCSNEYEYYKGCISTINNS